jgi:hypothetical protein
VTHYSCGARIARMVAVAAIALAVVLTGRDANAELASLYPNFWSLETPGDLQATLFGGGYASEHYATTQEGFQLEQSITPYIGLFGRATAYQVFVKHNQLNPFVPTSGHKPQYYFGRFQGGLDFTLYPGTDFFLSGGHDAGDSDSSLIEGDFSSWVMPHTSAEHFFQFDSHLSEWRDQQRDRLPMDSQIDRELDLPRRRGWCNLRRGVRRLPRVRCFANIKGSLIRNA